jgi:hypothetical protein
MTTEAEVEQQLENLTAKLNAYCDANGLDHLSADDLLCEQYSTEPRNEEHIAFLETFIEEWDSVNQTNVTNHPSKIAAGFRFRLFRPVERFPDFLAPIGLTGKVIAVDDSGVWGRMDQHIAGAEHWDNQIHWETPDAFVDDTVGI